jgi:hypothetical protein
LPRIPCYNTRVSGRTSYLAWALAWLCLCAASARAQDIESVDYETAVNRALSANADRDFVTAKRYMEHAHALEPSARTLRGLGIIAYGEGNAIMALRRFEAALAEQTKPLPESLRAGVAKLLIDVYALLGRYDVPVPAEAQLTVDARPPERDAQGRVLLKPGTHTLALMEGDTVRTLRVVTAGGELTRLTFPSAAAATADAPGPPAAQPSSPVERKDSLPREAPRQRNPVAISLAAAAAPVAVSSLALALVARKRFADATEACEAQDGGGCEEGAGQSREFNKRNIGEINKAAVVTGVISGVMLATAGTLWLTGVGKRKATVGGSADAHSLSLDVTVAF